MCSNIGHKENVQTVKNFHSTPVDDLNDILKSVPIEHFVGNEDTNIDTNVDNENLHENFNIDFIVGEDTVETENIMDTSDHNLNNQRSVEDCGLCRFCLDKPKNGGKGKLKKRCELKPKRQTKHKVSPLPERRTRLKKITIF